MDNKTDNNRIINVFEAYISNEKNKIVLFVYGTLRLGEHNYNRYLKNKSTYITTTTVSNMLIIAEGIPYLYRTEDDSKKVVIDVFEIEEEVVMENIDKLEGHSDWYKRIRTKNNDDVEGYIYCINDKIMTLEETQLFIANEKDRYIKSGDFLRQ